MPFVFKRLGLFLLSIAALAGADKDKQAFDPGRATAYPSKQTVSNVTIAAVPYQTDEQARAAFGKKNPYHYGILPVLIIIENDTNQTINLENMKVEYVGPDRSHLEATPAAEVRYSKGAPKPSVMTGPIPTGPKIKRNKNPLDTWEIEGRAFAARMLPAGQRASGFYYFQTGMRRNSQIYLTGIREASTGKDLFYFEIPLETN